MAPVLQQTFDDGLQHAPPPIVEKYHEAPQSYNVSSPEYDRSTQPALEVGKSTPGQHSENSHPIDTTTEELHQRSRGLRGLRRPTKILLIVLITVILVAAIIIGVAAGVVSNKKSKSIPTPTNNGATAVPQSAVSSSTSLIAIASHTITLAPSETYSLVSSPTLTISRDCPGSNGTTVVTNDAPPQTFIKDCGWLYYLDDISNSNGHFNAFQSTTSTLDACIGLCAAYNVLNGTGPSGNCSAVAWRTDVSQEYFGVCFGGFGAKGPGQGAERSSTANGDPLTDSALFLG